MEKDDRGIQTYITSVQETCIKLSFGALSMLHGLMHAVFRGGGGGGGMGAALSALLPRARLPMKMLLNFENIYDIETSYNDNEIPCRQRSPLVKLVVEVRNGFLHD